MRTWFEFRRLGPVEFGIRFAASKSIKVLEVKVDGEVMEALVGCSTVQYALVKASSKEDHPERLVIAYPDENCLRDLIARPSIVALGFTSRGSDGQTRWKNAGFEGFEKKTSTYCYVA